MIDLHFFDRNGKPITGKVPTTLHVRGSGTLSGPAFDSIQREFAVFSNNYRLGLYQSLTHRVVIDANTQLFLAVNQGVFTAVATITPTSGSGGASFFCMPFDEHYADGLDADVIDRTQVWESVWRDADSVPLPEAPGRLERSTRSPYPLDPPPLTGAHPGNTTWFARSGQVRGNVVSWWGPAIRYDNNSPAPNNVNLWGSRLYPNEAGFQGQQHIQDDGPLYDRLSARAPPGVYYDEYTPLIIPHTLTNDVLWINGGQVTFDESRVVRSACIATRRIDNVPQLVVRVVSDSIDVVDFPLPLVLARIESRAVLSYAEGLLIEQEGDAPPAIGLIHYPFFNSAGNKAAYVVRNQRQCSTGRTVIGSSVVELEFTDQGVMTSSVVYEAYAHVNQTSRVDESPTIVVDPNSLSWQEYGFYQNYSATRTTSQTGTIDARRTVTQRHYFAADYRDDELIALGVEHVQNESMSGSGQVDTTLTNVHTYEDIPGTGPGGGYAPGDLVYNRDWSSSADFTSAGSFTFRAAITSSLVRNGEAVVTDTYQVTNGQVSSVSLHSDSTVDSYSDIDAFGAQQVHFQVDSAINRGSSDALDVTASGSGVYDFEFAAGDLRADHVLLRTRPATLFNRSNLNNIPGLQNAKERLVDYHYSTAESLNGSGSQAYDSDYSSTVTGSVTLEHTLNLTEPEHMHAVAKFELDGNGLTFTPYNWSPANRSVVFNFGGITHGLTSTATPSGGVPNLPGAYDGPGNFSGAFLAGSLPLLDVYVYGGSNYSPALCMEGYGTEQTVSFDYDVPGYTPLDTTQFVSGTAPYDQPNPIRCNGINGFDTLNFQAYLSHPFTVPEANPADEPIATVNPVTLLSQVCGFSVSALSPDLKLYYKALSLSPYWTGSVFQPFELEEWSSRGNLFTPILNNPLASSELERLAAPIFVGPIPGATA